ncbi:MAG: Bax inhibitor-1/YccA family protein [Chloroflexota bacterium]|nr:Bax inhibitor-1/YccA family protein [Chloroflexota bacterium]
MIRNPNNPLAAESDLGVRPTTALSVGFLTQAFGWMFAGLLLTAGVAYVVQTSTTLQAAAAGLFLPLFIVQIILVVAISAGINRLSAIVALGLFFVYAALMGVTLSFIFIAYSLGSIAAAFVSAAGMFGAAAAYGAITKRSLASIGGYAFMGLIGIVIASVVNLFLRSDSISWVISILGIGIFVVLTAWDVQKISRGQFAAATGSMEKGAVLGALSLYLDFINIFLFLLRLMGGRR